MIELTEQLRPPLRQAEGVPVRANDPQSKQEYVVLPAEMYERLEPVLEPGRLTVAEQRQLLHTAGLRAGWDGPAMDVYDRADGTEERS